ncbi:MAG: hypothetical protein AUG51_19240 [Acidobacteria bacterium 13_1_20CM_3_53_8]|nr:MAG: hypothetical protein AUG51_19240 [Acidobacteria bacterium 13_1_20CM_3_53_8]
MLLCKGNGIFFGVEVHSGSLHIVGAMVRQCEQMDVPCSPEHDGMFPSIVIVLDIPVESPVLCDDGDLLGLQRLCPLESAGGLGRAAMELGHGRLFRRLVG